MPRPRTISTAPFRAQADYLVAGYWQQEEGLDPFSLRPGRDGTITVNLTGLDGVGKTLARGALQAWEMVADLDFREVATGGKIRFQDDGSRAHTQFDFGGPTGARSATVTIGQGWIDKYGTVVGAFSFHSYMHEIGHALGLGHAGAYDGSIPTWPDGVRFARDSWHSTVMSYYGQDNNPNVRPGASRAAIVAPQIADILAIQQIYGAADGGVTAGNTVWGRRSTLDNHLGDYFRDHYREGKIQPYAVTFTIWDEGGIDRLDLSHHGQDQKVNLAPGGLLSTFDLKGNIIIAPGTLIEHYAAGRGNDRVWGNDFGNRITGNNGDDAIWGQDGHDRLAGDASQDRLYGGTGNDRLDGGAGLDRLDGGSGQDRLDGGAAADTLFGGTGDDLILGGLGNDRASGGIGNDRIAGAEADDSLSGGAGNDRLDGGLGRDRLDGGTGHDRLTGGDASDLLSGGAGDDRLDGGQGTDRMTGGTGRDVFVFASGADVITDFGAGDRLRIDAGLDRDGTLGLDDLRDRAILTTDGLILRLPGFGSITLTGATDLDALLGRTDLV